MNPAAASVSVDLPAPVRPATPTRSPATDRQVDPVEAVLAPSRIADAESFDLERGRRRRRRHRPSPSRRMTPSANSTTTTAAGQDEQPQPSIDRRVGHHAVGGPSGSRPEPARLEREGPLADVDERSEQDRGRRAARACAAVRRTSLRSTAREPAAPRGSTPARALHPRHHLDRRQDDERDPMAGAARDERLEQVVGQRREQEGDRGQERDEDATGRDRARTSGPHA